MKDSKDRWCGATKSSKTQMERLKSPPTRTLDVPWGRARLAELGSLAAGTRWGGEFRKCLFGV